MLCVLVRKPLVGLGLIRDGFLVPRVQCVVVDDGRNGVDATFLLDARLVSVPFRCPGPSSLPRCLARRMTRLLPVRSASPPGVQPLVVPRVGPRESPVDLRRLGKRCLR